MENVLGVGKEKIEMIERKLVGEKLKVLDEYCTFNCDKYDSLYLLKLNKFLFGDLYDDLKYRSTEYRGIIDSYLYNINEECLGEKNLKIIFDSLQRLWDLQPFEVGNTRTFIAFIKIINQSYNLGLNINLDTELYSGMLMTDILETGKKK